MLPGNEEKNDIIMPNMIIKLMTLKISLYGFFESIQKVVKPNMVKTEKKSIY